MSCYWNIECRRCGINAFRRSACHYWTNRMGHEFAELCASGILNTKPSSGPMCRIASWVVAVTTESFGEYSGTIDLHALDTGCDHDFEPRDEYGHWATPDMWPDGHPKSKVVEGVVAKACTGLGDGRCVG